MKSDIHPKNFRAVIFRDNSNDADFLLWSTVETTDTAKYSDGKEYPLYRVEISSASHPFFTGTEKVLDTAGRVDRFKKRAAAGAVKKTAKAKK